MQAGGDSAGVAVAVVRSQFNGTQATLLGGAVAVYHVGPRSPHAAAVVPQ